MTHTKHPPEYYLANPPPNPRPQPKPPSCAFPGCKVPPTKTCSRCLDTCYCSKERQIAHRKWHKKICVAPQKKPPASVPPAPPVSLKGSVEEEEDDGDTCIICLENVANAKLRPYGQSATCRECTDQLRNLKEPCPLCRKKIAGFTAGKWQSTIGEHGLWPTSPENLAQLASGESFNEYFQNQFNGNEASYLRWKEVFDVLEIGNARDVGPDLPLEQQALMITRSEDLVKLKAAAKLCSNQFFDDKSLLVVAWRRILEVLVLAMPPVVDEKKMRGKKKKKKKNDPRKLEILYACAALGLACNQVRDRDDAERYMKRAKEGLGSQLKDKGEYEEAKEVWERCLAGRMEVHGEDHRLTLASMTNLGHVYDGMENYEKALKYYERALKGYERGRWGRIIRIR